MCSRICSDEILEIEKGVVFTSMDGSGLYYWEKGKQTASLLTCFPNASFGQRRLYKSVVKAGDKVVLPPCTAQDIMVYDQKTRQTALIGIKKPVPWRRTPFRFWTGIYYGSHVYCIGHFYPAIIKIDVQTMELQYIADWVAEIEKRTGIREELPYLTEGIVQGDVALFPCCCANVILKLNLQTNQTEVLDVPVNIYGFNGICKVGDEYWLISRSSDEIVIWEPKKNCVEIIELSPQKGGAEYVSFHRPIMAGEDIYLLPIHARHVYRIHISDRTIEVCDELDYIVRLERSEESISKDIVNAPALIDGCLFFITGADYIWHIYDPVQKEEKIFLPETDPKWYEILKRKKTMRTFWNQFINRKDLKGQFPENKRISNEDFFDFINVYHEEIDMIVSRRNVSRQQNGQDIHNRILKDLR